MKMETLCSETIIKPSSPTPPHLTKYTLSLLDQLSPPFYVPVVLFYSASDTCCRDGNIAEKMKISLSKALSDFYPFAGRLKGNSSIECNDKGAIFIESKVHAVLSKFLENPDASQVQQFLPFTPYTLSSSEGQVLLAVKVSAFDCGGVGVGVCVSHKVADGSTVATFLDSWSRTSLSSNGDFKTSPCFDASTVFQPKDFNFPFPSGLLRPENLVTKMFHFGGKDLSRLRRNEFRNMNPTKVEAVTALIWKAALEAAKACSEKNMFPPSAVTHIVNIRSRATPPLSDRTVGNLWQPSVAPLVDLPPEGDIELHHLSAVLRNSIQSIDSNHVSGLGGEGGFGYACRFLLEAREMALRDGVELYRFSSWTRFPFYEVDLGFGKPTWVSTTSVPMKNVVILMGTRSGDGIEAWITLSEEEMGLFQANPELLQFVSASTT